MMLFLRIVRSDEEKDICGCNRPYEPYHTHKRFESSDSKWTMFDHTVPVTKPAHGMLPSGGLYARIALDTHEGKVEKLLLEYWKIPKPRLIMSILGGQKYFKLSDRLESNFINGIIDVALNSDAWLITNGYNVGIVQLVGEAINKIKLTHPKYLITAIAICKWGSAKDVDELTKSDNGIENNINDQEEHVNQRSRGERDLDMNHTHYLMLDDGTVRYYNIGDYRTKLCAYIGKLHHYIEYPIPIVTIVVEGGRQTIEDVYHDLKANIPVIIIDVKFDDINRYADTVYEIEEVVNVTQIEKYSTGTSNPVAAKSSKSRKNSKQFELTLDKSEKQLEQLFLKYREQLKESLRMIITHDDEKQKKKQNTTQSTEKDSKMEKKLIKALNYIMYCLQPAVRSGINIFSLNSDDKLSDTIFRTRQQLFKKKENEEQDKMELNQRRSKRNPNIDDKIHQSRIYQDVKKIDDIAQRSQLLELAMDWDCIEVARELILENSLNNILKKDEIFLKALTKGLPAFVYEFLKLGISPSKIFFPNETFINEKNRYEKFIGRLYTNEKVNADSTHLSMFIDSISDSKEKSITSTDDLNTILGKIIGDYMSDLYFRSADQEKDYRIAWGLEKEDYEADQDHHRDTKAKRSMTREDREKAQDYIMRDLFIWSILVNHVGIAKVLLAYLKYRICAALIATKILKKYHSKAIYGDLKDNYKKDANYFEQYAIACITQCEKNDSEQACQIVLQRIELYGYVSCLQVASDAEDKLFIATPCCVQSMNNIWYDKILPNESRKLNSVLLFIGIISFGLLSPFILTYRKLATVRIYFYLNLLR
ncbi:unnamed protein product [Rotaria sp. Silwood2]|nr:unnamed protein product [Rotaria sp. Silwood2]CAF2792944.1 unnamed protein product [Rotaria sp. Silwood2]